ncbi:plasmid replication initiator TrfA [Nitrosomonas eutropha]|uniref:plasmid replication initiator TrfA n=1 Tax=Nitrosomonas eutropha TaxID=916 RepID=UPI0008D5BF18|nr:plasmid replication initiator TrfA [Nitrosomonas eutropha]SEJ01052.1 TrfA protein [Nitrosomonas eutropha]
MGKNSADDLIKIVARIQEKSTKNKMENTPGDRKIAKFNNIIQLPLWPEDTRRFPNELLRSALFNARNRKEPRQYFKKAEIAVMFEGHITYQGEELRQDDQIVWLQLIHLARESSLGDAVEFTPHSFCKAIKWPIKNDSYERLRNCLSRMQATALSVYSNRLKRGVSISMIPVFEWQDENQSTLKKYRVQLAPDLIKLFDDVHYTQIIWQQRLSLPTGIATWLHGYYASHREPFPIKLETIKKGSGITTKRPAKVRELIEKALNALINVGFLQSWEIIGDLVHVKRASNL